jgi:hemoglobin
MIEFRRPLSEYPTTRTMMVKRAMTQSTDYGSGDATYQAAGGKIGIRKLVDCFFDHMGSEPKYRVIFDWHPEDKEVSRDKLALFLCGWMGGPRLFVEKYGSISIPGAHKHLKVTALERDLWLDCMSLALAQQDYPASLVDYLRQQLFIPAERIRQTCMADL